MNRWHGCKFVKMFVVVVVVVPIVVDVKGMEGEFFLHVVVVFGSFWDWFGRARIGLKLDPPFRAQIATKYKTRLSIF